MFKFFQCSNLHRDLNSLLGIRIVYFLFSFFVVVVRIGVMISGLFTYQTGRFLIRALKQFCGKRKISPTKEMETNYYSYRKENEKFDPNFTPLKKKNLR